MFLNQTVMFLLHLLRKQYAQGKLLKRLEIVKLNQSQIVKVIKVNLFRIHESYEIFT
jgi:hypothetical protein